MRKNRGFTLVEIMIVVVIIALLVAIAIPAFERARRNSHISAMVNDMRNLEHGADQYYIEAGASSVPIARLVGQNNYVKKVKFNVSHYGPTPLTRTTTSMTGKSPAGYTAVYNFTLGGSTDTLPGMDVNYTDA
ncbi:MAG TPA: prepilin-type N-terminal cleavage/methylation domain-containing protein, partial [Opitutales bacterium]|nr:prepilin-type N-terminal cleavage/methylation domain-containing protein [Opitutales bacterium]